MLQFFILFYFILYFLKEGVGIVIFSDDYLTY